MFKRIVLNAIFCLSLIFTFCLLAQDKAPDASKDKLSKGNRNIDLKDINILEDLNDGGQKPPVKKNAVPETVSDVREIAPRLDVPLDDDQKKALANIREIYAEKYKSSDSRIRHDLAVEFLSEAKKKEHAPAVRYVFFTEAIHHSAYAGDVAKITDIVKEIDGIFRINRGEFAGKELAGCEKFAKSPGDPAGMAQAYVDCYLWSLEDEFYDDAAKNLNAASIYAKKANNPELMNEIKEFNKEIVLLKKEYLQAAGAFEKIKADPDDPAANFTVGKFYCFVRGDWGRGLPMLAKSQDEKMKQIASEDLKNPENAVAMTHLADGWWNIADDRNYVFLQKELRMRALFWYEKILPSLTSLEKLKIEKKIDLASSAASMKRSSLSLPKGAVLAFSFEKNTILKKGSASIISDLSGQGNDGIMHDVKFTKGAAGDAAEFNGRESYIEVKESKSLALDDSLTIAMWLDPVDFGGRRNPFHKCYGGEGALTIEPGGTINFFTGTTGKDIEGGYIGANSSKALLPGKWNHIAVVRDPKANKITWYFNGAFASGIPFNMEVKASKANIFIGRGYVVNGFYNGLIDELSIFNRPLSEKEVKELFSLGKKGQSF